MAGRKIDYLLPSLVASFGRNARLPAKGVKFIGESRPLVDGPLKKVSDFTDDEILTSIRTRWTRGGVGGANVHVAHGGGVQSAHSVLQETSVTDPLAFIETGVAVLLDESRRLDPKDPFRALLGEDLLGQTSPIMLSAEERILRLLEAVVTGIGQMSANGLDARILFDRDLLASTLRFVRGHVVRNGMEQGLAFELVDAVAASRLPLRLPMIHQMPLPGLKAPHSSTNGFDGMMDTMELLVPRQVKAFSTTRALTGGVTPHWIGRTLDSVKGVNGALAQVVSDRFRNSVWGHLVPGPRVPRPYPKSQPTVTTDWRPVSPVTVVTFHSQFLVDTAIEIIATGMWKVRTPTLNIARDLDVPGPVKTHLRAIVGGKTVARDTPVAELRERVLSWLDVQAPIWEARNNNLLLTRKIRRIAKMDTAPEMRLAASHQQQRLLDIYSALDVLVPGGER